MRKVLKSKRKSEDVKSIRAPIKSSGQNRLRGGSNSVTKLSRKFTIVSTDPSRRKSSVYGEPITAIASRTNLCSASCETDGAQSIETSPPSHRSYGGQSRKTDFTMAQLGGAPSADTRSLDYMSEGVVQVVEELMEQTCILKNRLMEMVVQYQEKLCQCSHQNVDCACLAGQPGGYYVQEDVVNRRTRAGTILRDSSGYESATARDSLVPEAPLSVEYRKGYVDCRCEKTNPRSSAISETPARFSNAYTRASSVSRASNKFSKAYIRPSVVSEVRQQRQSSFSPRLTVASEAPTERLSSGHATQCGKTSGCPCSQPFPQQEMHNVSNQFPHPTFLQDEGFSNRTRLFSGNNFRNSEASNSKRLSESGYKSAPEFSEMRNTFELASTNHYLRDSRQSGDTSISEQQTESKFSADTSLPQNDSEIHTQAELSKKLANAQKQIDDLKKLVKGFISCNCSKNASFQQKRTSTELIGKADSIQELLSELKCDCSMKPDKCRLRSGVEHKKPSEAESSATKPEEKSSKQLIAEPKSDKTESQKSAGPTKVIPQINSSIREINTIKQNDVVFSPDGRVIKTIEKLQRTEIVEGQQPQSPDLAAYGNDLKTKTQNNCLYAEKQGNKHKSNAARLQKGDCDNQAFQRDSGNSETSSKSSISNHRRKTNPKCLKTPVPQRNKSEIRLKSGFEKQSFRRFRRKHKKKGSHKNKKNSPISTESSADGLEEEPPQESSALPLKTMPIYQNDDKHNEEYIIREYIYPKTANRFPSRNDCEGVSLIGCKFSDRNHPAAHKLNLGSKADSYFIEVMPKKSHSFNGISAPQNQQHLPNMYNQHVQRRPSASNILDSYRNNVGPLSNIRHYHAEEQQLPQKLVEQTPNVCHQARKSYEPYMPSHTDYDTLHTSLSAARMRQASPLGVLLENVNIDQIPHIIRQLGGKRTSKEFFISVMPEKKSSKSLRVNVIDKESGNLLGYFFVDENEFHRARANGLFDNYLSLFVLNSFSTFTDFGKPLYDVASMTTLSIGSNVSNWVESASSSSALSSTEIGVTCPDLIHSPGDVKKILRNNLKGQMALAYFEKNKTLGRQFQTHVVHCIADFLLMQKKPVTRSDFAYYASAIEKVFPGDSQ